MEMPCVEVSTEIEEGTVAIVVVSVAVILQDVPAES